MAKPYEESFLPASDVTIVLPDGTRASVPASEAQQLIESRGARIESTDEAHQNWLREHAEDRPTQAFIEAAAGSASLGLTDVLSHGDEEFAARRRYNPYAATAGAITGALLPTGAGAVGGMLGKEAGAAITEGLGGGFLARTAGALGRGAAEGAFLGFGEGASASGLSSDPLDAEHIGSNIASGILLGGAIGGGTGLGFKLLEEGALAAKGAAARRLASATEGEAATAGEASTVDRGKFPELAGADRKAAREMEVAEKEALKGQKLAEIEAAKAEIEAEKGVVAKAKDAAAQDFYDTADEYRKAMKKEFVVVTSGDKELQRQLVQAKNMIKKGLDNPKAFIRYRGTNQLLDGLEKEELALSKVLGNADEAIAAGQKEAEAFYDGLPKSDYTKNVYLSPEQSKWYARWAGREIKAQEALSVTGEELDAFRDAIGRGDTLPSSMERIQKYQDMLEVNQHLQEEFHKLRAPATSDKIGQLEAKIEDLRSGPLDSEKLKAIRAHIDDLSATTKPGFGERLTVHAGGAAGASIGAKLGFGVAGPMGGAIGGAAGWALGREAGESAFQKLSGKMSKGAASTKKAVAQHVANFFDKGAKAASKVTKAATPVASKILPSISYAHPDFVRGVSGPSKYASTHDLMVKAFRDRADELNAVTQRQPDGSYSMRMVAREQMNQRLQGLYSVNPMIANQLEKLAMRRVQLLAEKLPRNPAPPTLQFGPDDWQPSKADMAKFARYMEAVDHPEKITARMANGTMTPEDAEVLKKVYPAMHEDIRQQILTHGQELQQSLPYKKRLALSIFFDVPIDKALTPQAAAFYQNQQPPTAPPPPNQSKAMKSNIEPTPGQKMTE